MKVIIVDDEVHMREAIELMIDVLVCPLLRSW